MCYFHVIKNQPCTHCGKINADFNVLHAHPFADTVTEQQQTRFVESNRFFRLMCSCDNCRHPHIFDVEFIRQFVRERNQHRAYAPQGYEISAYLNRLRPEIQYNSLSLQKYSAGFTFQDHKWGDVLNEQIRIVSRYPSPNQQPQAHLPPTIEKHYNRLLATSDPTLQVFQCRRLLEAVCKEQLGDQYQQGQKLTELLFMLLESEKLTEALKAWIHTIRLLGNKAAHDDETDYTQLEAQDLMSLITALLELVYTYPHKVNALRQTQN